MDRIPASAHLSQRSALAIEKADNAWDNEGETNLGEVSAEVEVVPREFLDSDDEGVAVVEGVWAEESESEEEEEEEEEEKDA